MPITARYGVDKTEKRQPRRKAKHLRLHNVCPLLRHPQNDADLEPHPHLALNVICWGALMRHQKRYVVFFASLRLITGIATAADEPKIFIIPQFTFEHGKTLDNMKVAYDTDGELNAARDSAVLIVHRARMNKL